jgi:superfamily I DNA/RNA helicase
VHKAKGLEWGKVVLIAGTFKNRNKGQEEANIYYVAVTRAKRTLVLAE